MFFLFTKSLYLRDQLRRIDAAFPIFIGRTHFQICLREFPITLPCKFLSLHVKIEPIWHPPVEIKTFIPIKFRTLPFYLRYRIRLKWITDLLIFYYNVNVYLYIIKIVNYPKNGVIRNTVKIFVKFLLNVIGKLILFSSIYLISNYTKLRSSRNA